MKRLVSPEILDTLDGADPEALRSRRDLRLINFLMGNERWLLKEIAKQQGTDNLIELGAGDGSLSAQLLTQAPQLTALDFQPCPPRLKETAQQGSLIWKEGDLFQTLKESAGDTIIANLILHHFQDEQLRQLGPLLQKRQRLLIVEPLRSALALAEGRLLFPLINRVTRHDMLVSIRAGFTKGELPRLLGLDSPVDKSAPWQWREESTLRGGYRMVAWRVHEHA